MLTPALVGGTNFAVGGARSHYGSPELTVTGGVALPPPAGTPLVTAPGTSSVLGQLGFFASLNPSADPAALYVSWSGGNDLRDVGTLAALGQGTAATALFNQSVSDVALGIGALIGAGARNLLIPTVTDLGLTPEERGLGATFAGTMSLYAQADNAAIDLVLNTFAGLPGLNLYRPDTFVRLNAVAANPAAFGISNFLGTCVTDFFVDTPTGPTPSRCTNAAGLAFYHSVHPTYRHPPHPGRRFLRRGTVANARRPAPARGLAARAHPRPPTGSLSWGPIPTWSGWNSCRSRCRNPRPSSAWPCAWRASPPVGSARKYKGGCPKGAPPRRQIWSSTACSCPSALMIIAKRRNRYRVSPDAG